MSFLSRRSSESREESGSRECSDGAALCAVGALRGPPSPGPSLNGAGVPLLCPGVGVMGLPGELAQAPSALC